MRNIFLGTALIVTLAGSTLMACSGNDKLPFDTGGAGGEGNGGNGNGGSGTGGDPVDNPQFTPAPGGIRKLLARQYINSIRLVLGDSAGAAASAPVDATLGEFETIAAAELALPPTAIENYEQSARDVASALTGDAAALQKIVPCVPAAPDDAACHQQVIENVGHQLWRRPLTPEEVTPIVEIAKAAGLEYGNFSFGVEYSIMTLIQSPYFLYTVEIGVPDPAHPGWFKLTGPELATRMSLFLVDSIPDADLLQKAESGQLETDDQVRAAAGELLKKPGARAALNSFYDVLYKLKDLPTTGKDPNVFPDFTPALAQSMRQESLMFFEDLVFDQNGDYRTIFTADYTFIDANLASLYGVSPPGSGFQKVTLPASQMRKGFLGQASHLARNSHAAQTSPTRRGVFLSNMLLCNEIPPPPPGVNTTFPQFDPGNPMTKKEYLEQIHHQVNQDCMGCHSLMDPFGYAMETFDGIGKYRTVDENGLTLDPSGEVADFGQFANAGDLAQLMHDDQRTMNCIVSELFKQSMGHIETKGERPAITAIQDAFEASGFKLQDALVEIVASPAFNYVNLPK